MTDIELSIIVPCYNTSRQRLRECMDSLEFVGSILPFEVWFIDDGSKEDYIVSYVEEQANPHFHALRQPNMGCGGARNTGIEHSTGRYVTFVDSDDFIYYGPYIEILKVLKETQPDILAQGYSFCYKGTATDFMMRYDIHPSACSYIIRRTMLDKLRFTPNIFHEDEEFSTRLHLLDASLVTLNYSAYFYRQEPNSIIHNRERQHVIKRFNDFIGVIERLQHLSVDNSKAIALRRRLDIMAMCYIITLMRDTDSHRETMNGLRMLQERQLYPLPFHWNGFRYFFILTATCLPLMVHLLTPLVKLLFKIQDASAEKRTFAAYADLVDADEQEV